MTNMNKELALEKWLTIEESARCLSGLINDRVQESNIYGYAWNNDLVLSLMFDSYQIGDIGTFEQCSKGDRSIDNENICFKFDAIVTIEKILDIVNKAQGKSCIHYLWRAKSDSSFSKPAFEIQSNQDNAIYLADPDGSSNIWQLNANKGLEKAKNFPNDAVIVIRKDRLNELASSINDNFTDGNSTIHPVSHPLEAFHRMVDLSFKEVTFSIKTGNLVVTVAARGIHKKVAYSDLGLTNKTDKVNLNAQGKLFVSIIGGDTVKKSITLTRLTKALKDAFSTNKSPFKNYRPIFSSKNPTDERAKHDALKSQISFDESRHSPESTDDPADDFLKVKDDNYNPEEFKN
jgi:hypothetical protein